MSFIKNLLKKILNERTINYLVTVTKYHRYKKNIFKTIGFLFKGLFKLYIPKGNTPRGLQLKKAFEKVEPKDIIKNGFVHYIDVYKIPYSNKRLIENSTIDYEMILNKSLNDLFNENNKLAESDYKTNQKYVLEGIEVLIDKTIISLEKNNYPKKYITYFKNMKNKNAESLEEALQRILFYNQLLWQSGHLLNGLGRLDKILYPYYKKNNKNAKKLITNFLKTLHSYYWIKSSSLLGDTGQIIILGGINEKGKYFCNDLTYLFIECIKELHLPDPKVLLRVSKNIPRDLMEKSLECIKTGIGCPLFANDDIIIPKLIDFGYDKKDAYDYITSACWEPLILGKSMEHNNIRTLVYMTPFNEMFEKEKLAKIKNLDDLILVYKKYLTNYVTKMVDDINSIEFEEEPLMSLFVPNCNKTLRDVTNGGAVYNNFGVTSVSLANVVNSLINIDKYVFKEKKYKLNELNEIRLHNFNDNNDLLLELKNQEIRFGLDNKEVVDLCNSITDIVNDVLSNKTIKYNGKVKFGLSSPSYITDSINSKASFDGRCDCDPFSVHISSDINGLPYTELMNFVSDLNYTGNRFNGNVIDFMVSPDFIENNFDKFTDFLITSIEVGFFEMQMNVLSSEMLIRAKKHPEEFPNLIVRVWGFSAYFNDLPKNYKDVLIERALISEGKNN